MNEKENGIKKEETINASMNKSDNEKGKMKINESVLSKRIYQIACSATLGAFVTSFVVTPLDVVKVRMQSPQAISSTSTSLMSTSMIDGLIKIGKSEGLKYLWRGLVPTLVISMPSTILYFVGYETIKEKLTTINIGNRFEKTDNNGNNEKREFRMNPITSALIAGPIARVMAASVCSPLELLRTKMQSLSKEQGKAIIHIRNALINEGPRILWRGLIPTLWRDVPFSGIYWCSLEIIRKFIKKWRKEEGRHHSSQSFSNLNNSKEINGFDRVFESFIGGAMSGMIASALTTPFDVAKTRRQVNLTNSIYNGSNKPPSMWSELIKIGKDEGLVGLTRGIIPRMSKVAPACAIMIGSYEMGKLYFNRQALSSL